MKKCCTCKEIKDKTQFHKYKRAKDGLKHYCKICANNRNFEYRKTHSKKYKYIKKNELKRSFNISLEFYNDMLLNQNSNCAICKINRIELNKDLCVDHNHSTGKIRGLLCHKCNSGLGLFQDNINILFEAVKYLKNHNE